MLPAHAPSAAGYNEHHDEDELEEDMQGRHHQKLPSRWPEQVIVEQQQLNETIEQELIPQQATEQLNN